MGAFALTKAYETSPFTSRPRILLADDRPENLVLLEKILARTPAELILAHSGQEALEILKGHEVAVALLDVSMPEISGLDVAQRMLASERPYQTPILFVTAFQKDDACVADAYELGAADFLVKPLRPGVVRAKVNLFLDLYLRRKNQELTNHHLTLRERELRDRNEALESEADEIAAMINQMEARHRQLELRNEELQGFAYVASHDLLQPLQSVMDYLEVIEHESSSELSAKTNGWLESCARLGSAMRSLITDMLEYSGLATAATPLEPTDCNQVLRNAMESLTAAIKQNEVQIYYPSLPFVAGSTRFLTRLFENLIGNAIKYRSSEPLRVDVRCEWDAAYRHWRFCVQDNGCGIPEKDHADIFEMFFRSKESSSAKGSGIGLAICRRIVETHGGTIWVKSEAGHGSEFWFTLQPVIGAQQQGEEIGETL